MRPLWMTSLDNALLVNIDGGGAEIAQEEDTVQVMERTTNAHLDCMQGEVLDRALGALEARLLMDMGGEPARSVRVDTHVGFHPAVYRGR